MEYRRKRSWSNKQLIIAVKDSFSYRQVLKKIGLKEAGGNYEQVKKYIKELGLKIGHFRGKAWNKGLSGIGRPRLSLEKILVKNSSYQSYKLKKRLFIAKLKPEFCEECGWAKKTEEGQLHSFQHGSEG